MTSHFDYFVVFAEMRTGSNLLESHLNTFPGVQCHGEAFNQNFIGYPNKSEILGVTQAMRESHPAGLIDRIKSGSEGLGGFRFFHDHDQRALQICLADPRCGKIILTRNPAESYVSWKIAQETGQWKLTNVKHRRSAMAQFDAAEFEAHVSRLHAFQVFLLNSLQKTGQTAFYIAYEDLQDLAVINGLAAYLGCEARLDSLDGKLKIQNPQSLGDKVVNFDEMIKAVAALDQFNLTRVPNFEPRRGPAVPTHVAGVRAPLLFMPVRSGPEREVAHWMAALDGAPPSALVSNMDQKALRGWKSDRPGHRSFTVIRHPLARAHAAFCNCILNTGPDCMASIRRTLRNSHKLPLSEDGPDETWDRSAHRTAFVGFLQFLRANLRGQTAVRIDANWASQTAVLQGMGQVCLPDCIIREEEMSLTLTALAKQVGYPGAEPAPRAAPDRPFALGDIYDDEIEALAAVIYQRDYVMLGFGPWRQ